MRVALIIRSTYAENNVVPARNAFDDTGSLVEARLSNLDGGFKVVALPADRDLPETLDRLFEGYGGKLEVLVLHFSGYLAVKSDRGLALLLDGSRLRAFPVSRLRTAIANVAEHALAIMDVVAVAEGAVDAHGVASSLGAALNESTPRISAISSVALPDHTEPSRRGCFRLTDLWLLSFEAQERCVRGAAVSSESVVRGLCGEPLGFANLPSFDYRPSDQDFMLIPGTLGDELDSTRAYNRNTLPSVVAGPPEPEVDSNATESTRGDGDRRTLTSPDDMQVDSEPATQVNDDELLHDEDLASLPPPGSRRPGMERAAAAPSCAPISVKIDSAPRSSQPAFENPVDRAIDWADRLAYRGDAQAAAAEYERLIDDLKLQAEPRLHTLYASLGAQYRKMGDIKKALAAFEETLALDARNDVAHNAACEIHRECHDWESLSQTVRRRLHTATDERETTDLLDALADIWLNQAKDPRRAIAVIEERLAVTPNDIPTLERLLEAYDRDGDSLARIAQREKLASVLDALPAQKSLILVESAHIALHQLDNIESAQSFVDRAVEADPKSIEAFELGIDILNRQERWPEVLQKCLNVLSDSGDSGRYYPAASRLLELFEARGLSLEMSKSVLDRLHAVVEEDEELEQRVDKVLAARDAYAKTSATLRSSLAIDPCDQASLRALSDVAAQQHDVDLAAMASAVLIGLQCASPEDESRAAELVTEKLVDTKRALNESDFTEQLLVRDVDLSLLKALSRVQDAIGTPAATEVRGAGLPHHASGSDSDMPTSVRALTWAASFVGVDLPELVALPEHSKPLELTIGAHPRLLHGLDLAGHLPLSQLAFLAACQLTLMREEFLWRAAHLTQDHLASTIGLCVRFAHQGSDILKSVDDSQRDIARRILAKNNGNDLLTELIAQQFRYYDPEIAVCDELARRCIRAADRSRLRIGLLACANPVMAFEVARKYPLLSPLSVEEQLDEIARFATSRDHLNLRKSLGINVGVRASCTS
jgi:tetratricopeptide (TPR) repeat protein